MYTWRDVCWGWGAGFPSTSTWWAQIAKLTVCLSCCVFVFVFPPTKRSTQPSPNPVHIISLGLVYPLPQPLISYLLCRKGHRNKQFSQSQTEPFRPSRQHYPYTSSMLCVVLLRYCIDELCVLCIYIYIYTHTYTCVCVCVLFPAFVMGPDRPNPRTALAPSAQARPTC